MSRRQPLSDLFTLTDVLAWILHFDRQKENWRLVNVFIGGPDHELTFCRSDL